MSRALFNGSAASGDLLHSRALHYGDGVFRTMLIVQSQPYELERHLQRLDADCAVLGLDLPDVACLREEAAQLCAGQDLGVLKIILARKSGLRGYRPEERDTDRILIRYSAPFYPASHWEEGVRVFLSPHRMAVQPMLAGVKHLNRLEQVLASRDWPEDAEEGVLSDTAGHLVCGTRSNLFWVRDGRLYTPALTSAGIDGVIRNKIMELCVNLNVNLSVVSAPATALERADEIFVTNALIGIWPVRSLGARSLPAPGTLTWRLMQALNHPRLV